MNMKKRTDYEKALQVLGELTRFGINLGLERITALLGCLGSPQDRLPAIHIAGTNGKGSTSAILSSVLRETGRRVGTYTSPHLESYTERITVNGVPIPEEEFARLLLELIPAFDQVRAKTGENPTEFEVLTALAFLHFFRQKADIVVLEAGLGGDIDSTNVIKDPLLSIITNISVEHTEYLGKTIEEIAVKKSGIIKPGCPAVTAVTSEEALRVLKEKAQKERAPLYEVYREVSWRPLEEKPEGQTFWVKTKRQEYGELFLPLKGEHQLINGATALLALEVLAGRGWEISDAQIINGFGKVKWPGRLEQVRANPAVILDGAHNPAGLKTLADWLEKKRNEFDRVILVIGMLADKDRLESARLIEPFVDKVFITRPPSLRAGNWQELAAYFRKDAADLKTIEDLSRALSAALAEAGPRDLVMVTGSLYLIGEARRLLKA